MASPLSGWVLGGGALLASPALRAALLDGTLPLSTAVLRLVIAVVVCWVGLSLLGALVSETSAVEPPEDETPRSLPGVDGPLPVRAAVVDPQPQPPTDD
jgi:hypothetical protein